MEQQVDKQILEDVKDLLARLIIKLFINKKNKGKDADVGQQQTIKEDIESAGQLSMSMTITT
jgi:hypothetical protein